MDNYDSIFAPKKQDNAKSYAPFDKEAWVQRKQAERQSAYALMDETAERMATDGDTFRACLDVMARFDRYSVDTHAAILALELFAGFQQHDAVLALLNEAARLLPGIKISQFCGFGQLAGD